MPELPEVETIRCQLARKLPGEKIERVFANCPSLVFRGYPRKGMLAEEITGKKIVSVERRGKYLLLGLDRGLTLALHLGMSGTMLFRDKNAPRDRHCHLELFLKNFKLSFRDPRMFGRVALFKGQEFSLLPGLARLGPEPLSREFNPKWLAAKFQGRKAPVKSLLMDQRIAAGIGNIYSDEACFLARISPLRKAGRLKPEEISRLDAAIKKVLRESIAAIGCTFRDYRTSEGTLGGYQPRVYGREGRRCKRCPGTVVRKVIANRSSFFCPKCQR